jgi:uncharacterized membrane-anchored protein
MKLLTKGLLLVAVLSVFFAYKTSAQNLGDITYHAPSGRYSFTIPKDNDPIPDSAIKSMVDLLGEDQKPDFAKGYFFTGGSDKAFMVVVEFEVPAKSTKEQIEKYINDDLMKDFEEEKTKAAPSLAKRLGNMSYGQPTYDSERNFFLLKAKESRPNQSDLVVFMGTFIGKENMVTINFYTPENKLDQNLPIFEKMISSFQWEPGYEYKATNDSLKNFGATAVSAAFMAFIAFLVGSNKKKEDKK